MQEVSGSPSMTWPGEQRQVTVLPTQYPPPRPVSSASSPWAGAEGGGHSMASQSGTSPDHAPSLWQLISFLPVSLQ